MKIRRLLIRMPLLFIVLVVGCSLIWGCRKRIYYLERERDCNAHLTKILIGEGKLPEMREKTTEIKIFNVF